MEIKVIPSHSGLTDMPSATNTDHDGRYYSEDEIDTLISNLINGTTAFTGIDINGGTVDGITSLTVANAVNIGLYDLTAGNFYTEAGYFRTNTGNFSTNTGYMKSPSFIFEKGIYDLTLNAYAITLSSKTATFTNRSGDVMITGSNQAWSTSGTVGIEDTLTCHDISASTYSANFGSLILDGGIFDVTLATNEAISEARTVGFPNLSGTITLTGTTQDWLTSGTLGAGAITGTSLTDSGQAAFNGGSIASGTGINNTYTLASMNAIASALTNTITVTDNSPGSKIFSLNFNSTFAPALGGGGAALLAELTGGDAEIIYQLNDEDDDDTYVENIFGYNSRIIIRGGGWDGGGGTGKAWAYGKTAHFYAGSVTDVGVTDIAEVAAFYDSGQTVGTKNWGLAINTATNYINGKLRIGSTVIPTAYCHLAAGTTAAGTAPLKFTNATDFLTTPEAGALEYHNSRLYLTNVATRKALDRTSDVETSTTTVANTDVETALMVIPMPANSLVAGNVFKLHADGVISNDGNSSDNDITIRVRIGSITGTAVLTLLLETKALTDDHWDFDANATQRTLGGSGSRALHAHIAITDGVDCSVHGENCAIGLGTVDTTDTMDVYVTAKWETADANNTISIYQGFIEFKN